MREAAVAQASAAAEVARILVFTGYLRSAEEHFISNICAEPADDATPPLPPGKQARHAAMLVSRVIASALSWTWHD